MRNGVAIKTSNYDRDNVTKKLRHKAMITGNIYLMHTTCQDKFPCFVLWRL